MTDLLSAEDIKKAVGAFAGEQRAPLPSPLPSPTALAPAPPRPSARASGRRQQGREWGSSAFPKVREGLRSGGEARHPAPETENLRTAQAGCPAAGTGVPNQGRRPGGRQDLRVLVPALDFPFKARGRGCRHLRPLSDPFWTGSSHPVVGRAVPTTVRTPHPGAQSPLPTTRE